MKKKVTNGSGDCTPEIINTVLDKIKNGDNTGLDLNSRLGVVVFFPEAKIIGYEALIQIFYTPENGKGIHIVNKEFFDVACRKDSATRIAIDLRCLSAHIGNLSQIPYFKQFLGKRFLFLNLHADTLISTNNGIQEVLDRLFSLIEKEQIVFEIQGKSFRSLNHSSIDTELLSRFPGSAMIQDSYKIALDVCGGDVCHGDHLVAIKDALHCLKSDLVYFGNIEDEEFQDKEIIVKEIRDNNDWEKLSNIFYEKCNVNLAQGAYFLRDLTIDPVDDLEGTIESDIKGSIEKINNKVIEDESEEGFDGVLPIFDHMIRHSIFIKGSSISFLRNSVDWLYQKLLKCEEKPGKRNLVLAVFFHYIMDIMDNSDEIIPKISNLQKRLIEKDWNQDVPEILISIGCACNQTDPEKAGDAFKEAFEIVFPLNQLHWGLNIIRKCTFFEDRMIKEAIYTDKGVDPVEKAKSIVTTLLKSFHKVTTVTINEENEKSVMRKVFLEFEETDLEQIIEASKKPRNII
ncbi:MAG: hypothetical protein M1269_03905 [Chloroflexi bacterium]|nr:hypothetical protein [Chloroflexota bacterium]